jgi:hypothetical protein
MMAAKKKKTSARIAPRFPKRFFYTTDSENVMRATEFACEDIHDEFESSKDQAVDAFEDLRVDLRYAVEAGRKDEAKVIRKKMDAIAVVEYRAVKITCVAKKAGKR